MIPLENGIVFGIGLYEDAKNEKMYPQEYRPRQVGSPSSEFLLLSAVGIQSYQHTDGSKKVVKRKATLGLCYRNLSDWVYLTDSETTRFGEGISHWSVDSFLGNIRSNSNISVGGLSLLYSNRIISSSQNVFVNNQSVNSFHYSSNQPIIKFRERANHLRSAAADRGQYLQSHGSSITYEIRFEGGLASE